MAIHLKENPVGEDIPIAYIQKKLFDKLSLIWQTEIEAYPICFPYDIPEGSVKYRRANSVKERTISHYIKKDDYLPLIYQEKNKFFFLVDNVKQESKNVFNAEVQLFFIINLIKCKGGNSGRLDTEARVDVLNILNNCKYVSDKKEIELHTRDIFQGYNYENNINSHPYHCFKINFTINDFNLLQKNCCV